VTTTVEHVWETFHAPLLHFIERRVADPAAAEDIRQDVFLKVHARITTLQDEDKLPSWLYQITRNAITDYYRQRRPELGVPETLPAEEAEDEREVERVLALSVRLMLNDLPAIYREALVLTEYEGLTQKELAERLGISLSGAKSRVQRARQMLKQMLLDCCHFEFDRRGAIIDYQPRCDCCTQQDCESGCSN
jgi:RNA polymerase sigma-70 factor (ECF subfamily)